MSALSCVYLTPAPNAHAVWRDTGGALELPVLGAGGEGCRCTCRYGSQPRPVRSVSRCLPSRQAAANRRAPVKLPLSSQCAPASRPRGPSCFQSSPACLASAHCVQPRVSHSTAKLRHCLKLRQCFSVHHLAPAAAGQCCLFLVKHIATDAMQGSPSDPAPCVALVASGENAARRFCSPCVLALTAFVTLCIPAAGGSRTTICAATSAAFSTTTRCWSTSTTTGALSLTSITTATSTTTLSSSCSNGAFAVVGRLPQRKQFRHTAHALACCGGSTAA